MSNLNTNRTLNELVELVEADLNKRLNYMPDDFNNQQREALEMFKQRIFLEEVIEETTTFNRNLSWEKTNENLNLVKSAEELIDVFKLRSDVYTKIGYQSEFNDAIEGLNFDLFDKNSAIVYYKSNKEMTGTCRLIFDSENKLPSDKEYSFDKIRNRYGIIGEISRNAVKDNESKGLGLEFKYLMAGMHNVFVNNNINMTLSVMKSEHYRMFSKFGGNEIVDELKDYGNLDQASLIISWDPSQVSKFFKKAFLNQR